MSYVHLNFGAVQTKEDTTIKLLNCGYQRGMELEPIKR